jgi:hypothetical protein
MRNELKSTTDKKPSFPFRNEISSIESEFETIAPVDQTTSAMSMTTTQFMRDTKYPSRILSR